MYTIAKNGHIYRAYAMRWFRDGVEITAKDFYAEAVTR